jgi:hypothetical protein
MIPLFGVQSLVPEFLGYEDVTFSWFITDRQGRPSVPYAEAIKDYDRNNHRDAGYAAALIDELFTESEAEMLIDYLRRNFYEVVTKSWLLPIELPVSKNDTISAGVLGSGGGTGYLELSDGDDWDLPFTVSGFYDCRGRKPAPKSLCEMPPAPKSPCEMLDDEL